MARSGKTAQEFIRDSFSPIIAVLCSPKVENVVAKNNLTFTELLQPFTTMEWEGQFREPGGSVCTVKNWRVIVRDVNWKPLQPTEARRQLNNAVLHNYSDKTVAFEAGSWKFDIPQCTHWFDAWRETYLEVQFPSDHEFTKHFLSCVIVGVAHDENVIDSFNFLNQQYAQLQNIALPLPKWFNSGVLKSYLLIHDASVISREKADVTFETLKQTFGASNCFILSINSKSASDTILPDYWAPFVKRSSESNNEMPSSVPQATSPAEPQTVFTPLTPAAGEDVLGLTSSVQADNSHPLTSPDNDTYDNANSLQTHSFSGSAESVSVMSRVLDLSTEVHGICLNMNDIDDIKKFLQDYSQKALLPYLEKQIAQLSEVVANRKGVSRSFFTAIATKRWFGAGKTGNTPNNTVTYTSDCPELQLRRLGDLWFMTGQWARAFDAYHAAKREFYADSAFLFYAGALEMAAVSAFMAGDASKKTHGYMEESIVTYLNTCRMVQYAVRATLLSAVCLRGAGQPGEAARQLIRMTAEDSDLRSGMLLEQAALCFLAGPPAPRAAPRKYAFHMVLAGHRFSKAGQKKHAYRCYLQAYQVYSESGWRLATEHVQFALGRLAGALRRGADALHWLRAPLAPPPAAARRATQHHAFLREYMLAHQQWIEKSEEPRERAQLAVLPLPLVDRRDTGVLCAGAAPLSSPGRVPASSLALAAPPAPADQRVWARLEEMLLQVAQGSVPMIFKPSVDLYTDATDCDPIVPQGEPIQISITLWNPLNIPIVVKELELLWRFTGAEDIASAESPAEQGPISNEPALAGGAPLQHAPIVGQKIAALTLEGDTKKAVTFMLTPLRVGQLVVHGLAYKLVNVGEDGNDGITISGKAELLSGERGSDADRRLHVTVIPEAPCLQMTFSETSEASVCGELRTLDVELSNAGPAPLRRLHVAVSHPACLQLGAPAAPAAPPYLRLYRDKYQPPPHNTDERAARAAAWRQAAARHAVRVECAGGGARATLRLRASRAAPRLHLLAYYETGLPARPYRLLRHVFQFNVTEAVEVSVTPRRNLTKSNGEVLENMTLAVEVKNVCEQRHEMQVQLVEASLLSRQWALHALVAGGRGEEPLQPRERLHFILKAKRIVDSLPDEAVRRSSIAISETNARKSAAELAPFDEFVSDGPPSFPETNDALDVVTRESRGEPGLIESMFVVRWKVTERASGRAALCQQSVWLDCFSRPRAGAAPRAAAELVALLDDTDTKPDYEDNNKAKNDNVVILGLEHTSEISHDFKKRKLCLVPITLNIVNCYGIPVNVFIDMSKQKNREGGAALGWAGALAGAEGGAAGVRVRLARFEARRVAVRAVCAAPGTYLLGAAFSVTTWADAADERLAHLATNTSLLVVQPA